MKAFFIIYKQSNIRYYRFGEGNSLVFCLHGYGENGKAFQFLESHATTTATYIAIDLPYHGETEWNEPAAPTRSDLWEIVQGIAVIHAGRPLADEQFRVLGFSLGSRIALSMYEYKPARFQKLILLAPDGLKLNFWYWLATQTSIGKSLFKFTIQHTGWFIGFLKILNRFRLVNASIYKFTFHYIKDQKSRELLYQRWIGLRKFRPDLKEIKKQITLRHTQVRLVYGKHDRIILPVRGKRFRQGIEPNCSITIIDSGHQVLHERNIESILEALLN